MELFFLKGQKEGTKHKEKFIYDLDRMGQHF